MYQANRGFPDYHRIGKYVWDHDTDEETSIKHSEKENKAMKEIKLTIDGKEVQLTEEQLKTLNFMTEPEPRNPFKRVENGKEYCCIKETGEIYSYRDSQDGFDNRVYDNANYFNDPVFARILMLNQLLQRKLLKFGYENNCLDSAMWNGIVQHWYIGYDSENKEYVACSTYKISEANTIYFNSRNAANWAIAQVVRCFEMEHPEFKW